MRSAAVTEAWEFYRDNCPGFKEPMRRKLRELDEYVSRLEARLGKGDCKASKQRSMDGKVRGWQCHGCGAAIVTAPSGEEWPELPNYCPECGRRVVNDCR